MAFSARQTYAGNCFFLPDGPLELEVLGSCQKSAFGSLSHCVIMLKFVISLLQISWRILPTPELCIDPKSAHSGQSKLFKSTHQEVSDACISPQARQPGIVRLTPWKMALQVGGDHAALEDHIRAVDSHPLLGGDIDFKLARSSGPLNQDAIRESNFDRLRVVTCKVYCKLGQASLPA